MHSKVRRSWSASLVGLTRERNIGVPHISQDGDRSRLRRIIEMRLLHGEALPTRYRRERDFVSPPPTPDTGPVVDDLGFPPDQPHESIREGLKRYSIRGQRCKLSKCSLADVARRIISCFTTGMSDLGQKRTLRQVRAMSALPPKADKLTHRNYPQKSKGRPKTHQPFVSAASHVRTGKGVKSCSSTAATTITTT